MSEYVPDEDQKGEKCSISSSSEMLHHPLLCHPTMLELEHSISFDMRFNIYSPVCPGDGDWEAPKHFDDEDDDSPSANEKCNREYHSANSKKIDEPHERFLPSNCIEITNRRWKGNTMD